MKDDFAKKFLESGGTYREKLNGYAYYDSEECQSNLKALCIAASNKSSEMAFECRLNMAGI